MNNRFDNKYDIRLAYYEEIPEVMRFIDEHWEKNHILAKNRAFFEYEMVIDGQVNFLIAKEKDTKVIEGILGFLPCSDDRIRLDLWGVIWETLPNAMPMLGMELKKRLMVLTGARTDLGVGANAETSVPLLGRIFHYYTAKMKHYYRIADCDTYVIAGINQKVIPPYEDDPELQIFELKRGDEMEEFFDFSVVSDVKPYKNAWYYRRRFYEHPIYRYRVWGIRQGVNKAMLVTRDQECNGRIAVRIVDYIGDAQLFSGCGAFFDTLLRDCEYIDFYFDGCTDDP